MGKVIAVGKWSKEQKRWQTVIAIRRPGKEAPAARRAGGSVPRPNGAA